MLRRVHKHGYQSLDYMDGGEDRGDQFPEVAVDYLVRMDKLFNTDVLELYPEFDQWKWVDFDQLLAFWHLKLGNERSS